MRILFTGGGSGGHVFPLVAVARQLKKENAELYFLGFGKYSDYLTKEGIKVTKILSGKLRRYFSVQNILDIFKFPLGIIQCLWYLLVYMPDVIFSKGGYDSMPVVLVGWLYRIPIVIHESDIVPGLANRIAGFFCQRIAVSFKVAESYFPAKKTALVGNPIRLEVVRKCLSSNPEDIEKAKQDFGIIGGKPIIFVFGGSQGAKKINDAILGLSQELLPKYEIIHQCGTKNHKEVKEWTDKMITLKNYHLFPFLDEDQMANAYLLADLVVSRGGAGSIFEIAACKKPSILIPLSQSAFDHQTGNSFEYARFGATIVLEENNLTRNIFITQVSKVLNSTEVQDKLKKSAEQFSQLEAGQKIAQSLVEIAKA